VTELENEIEFKLRMGKEEYLPGQPAVAYLSLTNNGSQSISLVNLFDPKYDFVKFVIEQNGNVTRFTPNSIVDAVPKPVKLDPGESLQGHAKVFYGGNGYTFPDPGVYKIKAMYHGLIYPSKVLESNSVEVKIRAPRNKEEEEQVNLIKGEEQALFFLFEGGDHLENGIKNITELAEKYPNTVLGAYANAALGVHLSKDFKDLVKNKIRKPDINSANRFLTTAKDNVKGHWANSSYLTLARNYDKSGIKEERTNVLNEFVEKFGDDDKNAEGISVAKKILREEV
jgi:hypothetical protein